MKRDIPIILETKTLTWYVANLTFCINFSTKIDIMQININKNY
jgi:hypothetical protein